MNKEIDKLLAKELKVQPKMIRYYAARMIVELSIGKRLKKRINEDYSINVLQ